MTKYSRYAQYGMAVFFAMLAGVLLFRAVALSPRSETGAVKLPLPVAPGVWPRRTPRCAAGNRWKKLVVHQAWAQPECTAYFAYGAHGCCAFCAGYGGGVAPSAVFGCDRGRAYLGSRCDGNITQDSDPAKDGIYKQITEFEISPTSFWHTAIVGELEKEPPGSLHYNATGWENIFQLTPQGKYWADLGFYAEYEWGQKGGAADKVEWKILAQKNIGRMSFIFNPIFETQVGGNRSGGVEFRYAAQAKWRYMPQFEPAIEMYGTLGDIGRFGPWRDQSHQIGPVILGKFNMADIGALKYELGYLFGVTGPGSPSGAFKFSLEWERHF